MGIDSAGKYVVVGLGKTGLSCARYLQRQGLPFVVVDTRAAPSGAQEFAAQFPGVPVEFGPLNAATLSAAQALVMSPGVALAQPAVQAAIANGVRITGDIDLFAKAVQAPLVAITGSNAKTTVTTLLGEMARCAGWSVAVAGNIGTPVLDLLQPGFTAPELVVLELSSFQLETTSDLGAKVATILNLSEDHMDRYAGLADYADAKQRIFQGARHIVVNRDDAATVPRLPDGAVLSSFGLDAAVGADDFGIREDGQRLWLCRSDEALLAADEMRIAGRHNVANALAALALGRAAGLPLEAMVQALREFPGLPHRCQWVATRNGVNWYNDSKGTNVGASVAAITGLGASAPVILLAGGVGKGADFSGLAPALAQAGKLAILFGEDAIRIERALTGAVPVRHADDLQTAVRLADEAAVPGDVVLLSPACASFDMFRNYEHRGEMFVKAVEALH
ncbi:MAG TPA: UDP-N-acetylmuramoyl-L-alanine--D-glutamate ligase [Hyphomicrobiales bacterium]|nr:UDP-N-acetylmuramoyl-L-alanine--D-glutamate ligase [Hyphomicrobiales bacterium]